ncbi:MAG: NADH-quinone oxidoreductase subunit L [Syntrophomonadales bacterium]
MTWNQFLLIALALPLAVAVLNYFIRWPQFRKGSIIAMALALIASAIWLHTQVGNEPVVLSFPWGNLPILLLDLAILAYITYVGIERRHPYILLLAALQLAGLLYIEFGLRPDVGEVPSLVIDRLSVVMYMVISVVGSIICVYALQYMEEHDDHQHPEQRKSRFFLWFVMFLGIMNGLVFANNLFWLYFFWEATTLCSFELIGHEDTQESRDNALLALFLNSIGGLAMIAAIFFLVNTFGGVSASLFAVVNSGLAVVSTPFLLALSFLALGGFTKAALFPFQNWLLGAMVAPTPVSALLHSSTMVKAGVYLILRLAPAYNGLALSTAIAFFGGFTFVAASLLAVAEDNAKRVLAYSTVANLGLIVACCGINTPLAVNAAVLLIIFHAVCKALLFMGVGVIEHNVGSRNIENMEGLAARMPAMMLVMSIGVFGMFLPPFGVLFAKWAAMEASIREPLLIALMVAGSTLTALFWTKWLGRMLSTLPGEEKETKPVSMSGYYVTSLGTLALGVVLLSLALPAVVSRLALPSTVTWYPPAIQGTSGLSLAAFSWANYYNPEIILGNAVVPEGLFPLGLLFVGLLLMLVVPMLFSSPEKERVSDIYLSGENLDEGPLPNYFAGAMEIPSQVSLGGYYFRGVLNDRVVLSLNIIAIGLIAMMIGVVAL